MRRVDLAEADDADLVAALGRDAAAMEELYRRHVRPLGRYVARRVDPPDDAADLVTAVFLEAIRSGGRFDPERGSAAGWLYGIAANLIAAQRRRGAAESRAIARFGGRATPVADLYGDADDRVDAQREARSAAAILDALPPAERELIDLIRDRDLTVSEAAGELGIRPATARMRLARLRGRFRAGKPSAEGGK